MQGRNAEIKSHMLMKSSTAYDDHETHTWECNDLANANFQPSHCHNSRTPSMTKTNKSSYESTQSQNETVLNECLLNTFIAYNLWTCFLAHFALTSLSFCHLRNWWLKSIYDIIDYFAMTIDSFHRIWSYRNLIRIKLIESENVNYQFLLKSCWRVNNVIFIA